MIIALKIKQMLTSEKKPLEYGKIVVAIVVYLEVILVSLQWSSCIPCSFGDAWSKTLHRFAEEMAGIFCHSSDMMFDLLIDGGKFLIVAFLGLPFFVAFFIRKNLLLRLTFQIIGILFLLTFLFFVSFEFYRPD